MRDQIAEEEANEAEIRRIRQARLVAKESHQMSEHQVNQSGNCVISGCPCRGWSAQEGATTAAEPDIECQFCDFKGTFAEGAEHRRTTQHLIRTVAISELRHNQSSSTHQPAARGGGDETPERIWLTRKYGDRIWKPKAGVEAELQEYIRMDQHQSLVAERELLRRLLRNAMSPTHCYCAVLPDAGKCWQCEVRDYFNDQKRGAR